MHKNTPTLLIVSGLCDHVADHWQTLLQDRLPGTLAIAPLQENRFSCAVRIAALNALLNTITGPVILVAHSTGVIIVVHWARQASPAQLQKIRGALLVAPPDFDAPLPEDHPSRDILEEKGWLPTPACALPFPSIVAASTDDPLSPLCKVEAMARAWCSRLVVLDAVGHPTPAAGYGEWPAAEGLIAELA